jgi:single-strand DNA-binding protein
MNVFTAIGRCGRDAEVRRTQSGKAVAGWSIAVDSGFGENKKTTWFDCSLWGDRAEKLAEYIRKGDRIGVTGEIGTREHDGRTYVTLNVRDVTLLGEKRDQAPRPAPKEAASGDNFHDDDIPF